MKTRNPPLGFVARHAGWLCLLIILIAAGCARITSVSPKQGLPGTIVAIHGYGFDPEWHRNNVTIGGSPARVIEGSSTLLRVVALRDVATGNVRVTTPARTLVSADVFERRGDTLSPTPDHDSGPELIDGRNFPLDKHYDMAAKGVGQKILLVLAKPSDIDPETSIPAWASDPADSRNVLPFANAREFVLQLANHPEKGANRYFQEASFGQTSGAFDATPVWVPLTKDWDFYCWGGNDVTLAQTAVDGAQADLDAVLANPASTQADIDAATARRDQKKTALKQAQDSQGFLQQPDFAWAEALMRAKAAMGASFDDYTDYVLIVAGPFLRGACCWLTDQFHAESANPALPLGPFDVAFPAPRGGTYMAEDARPGRVAHELSHFFASGDLYDGSAGAFDLMGFHDSMPLYSGYNMDIKTGYFDESAAGNVVKLDWGSPADMNQTFDLIQHGKTQDPAGDSVKHMITLKVTDGLYYFVEVRQRPDAAAGAGQDYLFDREIPDGGAPHQSGVLITKAVENTNQSNNREPGVTIVPPETLPSPHLMQPGDIFTDPARTIRITVDSRLQDRPAKYRVRVEWGHLPAADPHGQFDLRITPWSPPPWETPDIWANSIKNDPTAPPAIVYKNHEPGDESKPVGNGDPPWVGHDNTLFARVTNQGAVATPDDVRVTFYVNTPPGIGDNGTWAPFDTVVLGHLAAGETRVVQANRKWVPAVGEHTCVKVLIEPMTGEVTFDNNQAQENFNEFEAEGSSPYRAVETDVIVRNPYDQAIVMDLQAKQVPKDWYVALDHGAVWLPPKGERSVHVVTWTDRVPEWQMSDQRPKDQGPRKALISIEGWTTRPETKFIPVGGVTTFVHAVRSVSVNVQTREKEPKKGERLTVFGHVSPAVASVPIAIHLTDPQGKLQVERASTDASGAYVHSMHDPLGTGGNYRLQVFVLSGSAAAEAESTPLTLTVH